jgi:Putative Actinobacterial Holin-X, holin superfamily III
MVSHMAHDTLRDAALVHVITDVLTDLSDLVQKELRLARAELTYKLTLRLQASIWFAIAGLLALLACLLITEGCGVSTCQCWLGAPLVVFSGCRHSSGGGCTLV